MFALVGNVADVFDQKQKKMNTTAKSITSAYFSMKAITGCDSPDLTTVSAVGTAVAVDVGAPSSFGRGGGVGSLAVTKRPPWFGRRAR
jgi:hypothetical protein